MRHHYVARFQLKYFAIPESSGGRGGPKVVVIPLDDRPTFIASTSNVACQHEMYAVEDFDDPQTVEKRLSILESLLSRGLNKLDDPRSLHEDDRTLIAAFVATQYLRTPAMFAWWGDYFRLMGRCYELARCTIGPPGLGALENEVEQQWRDFAESPASYQRAFAARQIIAKGKSIAFKLANRPWAFLRSPSGHFVTADEPIRVAVAGESSQVSLDDDAAIVYWPITPKCALLIGQSGLREGNYTVDGLEGRLNLWLAERATILITGRPPDEVVQEFDPWFGSGPPQFYGVQPS